MAFKQKKRAKNAKNRYLRPGALAQMRYNRASTKLCADIGKKRVVVQSKAAKPRLLRRTHVDIDITPMTSPDRSTSGTSTRLVDGSISYTSPVTPKTPATPKCGSSSILESLPMDLLVKILCHLHHDQLKAVFHVSQKIRKAVLLARHYYFNYTTPDRSRQEMLNSKTPLPSEHWPFISKGDGNGRWEANPKTPKAPRHAPCPPRFHMMDMSQIAAVLFQESAPSLPSKLRVPPGLPKPICKSVASTRVLFCEDELCHAVAHNKLR